MKYIEHLDKHLQIDSLLQQCQELYKTTAWTEERASEFETIDVKLTTAMLAAEKSIKKQNNLPWSPELDEAYAIYTYWRKKISANRNQMKVQDQLQDIIQKYGEKIYQGYKRRHPYQQLRRATRKYHKCQSKSAELRETHLQLLYEILVDSKNFDRAKAVKSMRNNERTSRMYKTVQKLNHPHLSNGGLSHVLTQDTNGNLTRIDDIPTMNEALFHRNRKHFAQADGTPCTQPVIRDHIGTSGTTQGAKDIINNIIPSDLPVNIKKLFRITYLLYPPSIH